MADNKLNRTSEDGQTTTIDGTLNVGANGTANVAGRMNVPGILTQEGMTINPSVWVDVTCTATVLDASTGTGKVEVAPAIPFAQFKVRDIILVGGGTNFGAGGDRLLSLTDGTTVYTTIANADLETAPAASLRWSNAKVPMLTGTSDTATAVGAQLYFQYSGGTPATPHTTGSIKFAVLLEKVV